MSNEVAVKEPPSVIADMAARFGMEKRAFESTIRATCMPSTMQVSNEQFAAFLLVAKQYNLNPITKEIYAFPAKSGGIQPIVGIDGWCNIINSHPQLNGIQFVDVLDEGKLVSITCKIHRKDRQHPVECTEYMSECKRDTQPWKQWPARMLRHKALIQCARYAFSFSGIVEQDEAERQGMIDVTPQVVDPNTGEVVQAKPSPFKTAKARRDFCESVQNSYAKANNIKELILAKELNKPTIDAMILSRNEHDQFGIDGMDIAYKMAEARINNGEQAAIDELKAEEEAAEAAGLSRQMMDF